MKPNSKCLIVILLLSLIGSGLFPGRAMAQRYIPKMSWMEVGAGSTEHLGFYVQADYGFYTRKKHHWKFGAHYRQDNYPCNTFKVPVADLTAEGGFFLRLFSDRKKTVFVSAGLQGIFGYEWVNWGSKRLDDGTVIQDRDRIIYGGALGLEIEYFLNDRYVLLLHVREKCIGGSDIGLWHTEYGAGLKMMLNR